MSRLLIVPDEKFEELGSDLRVRLNNLTRDLRWEHLIDLFGAEGATILSAIPGGDASREIQIWGRGPNSFIVVWSSKGQGDAAIGNVTAELGRGLINQVFESKRSETKAGDFLNASDWTNLENKRGTKLSSMAAHPVTVFGRCIAVLSLSRFDAADRDTSGDSADTRVAGAITSLLARLVEDRLIRSYLGLNKA